MKLWKKLAAALTGLCMIGTGALSTSALARDPLDLNDDTCFDVLDIICLTKYLHNQKSKLVYFEAADMDKDGQIDVFDLGLLKHALFYGYQTSMEDENVLLSKGYTAQSVEAVELDEQTILGQTKFALELIRKNAQAKENVLVSPYSVSQALGMTANGAKGDTLAEMETVLGGKMETLNPAFYTLRTAAPPTEDAKLSTANSIWVRQNYPVRSDFLQTNADFYASDAYSAPFDDSTLNEINSWVDNKTDHMVPSILDRIDDNAMLYLVNAVAFDAKWDKPYQENQISESSFEAANGAKETIKMMQRYADGYLEDEHAAGFLQYYKNHDYAFAALLPEQGMTPEEYLAELTPEHLHKMLAKPQDVPVYAGLPQFEYDFGTLLNDSLQTMGMPTAFSEAADFSGMTDSERGLYIGRVIHKTHIEVTPVGTRAGAATVVEMLEKGMPFFENQKNVSLNRPFVYMIVDTKTSLPVFIGTVNHIS